MEEELKPELEQFGMEILAELLSLGMDEIEIMNFWQQCFDKVKKNKNKTFRDYEQN